MKTVKIPSIGGLLLLFILLSGCESSKHAPKSYTVYIKDMKFVPETITVAKGDTIIWINRDMMAHDATEEMAKTWTSGPIVPGGSWKAVVSRETRYYCSIHAVMKGSIQVQ